MTTTSQKAEFVSARISSEANQLIEEFRDAQLIRPTRSAAIDALIKIGVPAWRRGERQKAAA
jgi:hypothetical protein